jgi:hypothetical protein
LKLKSQGVERLLRAFGKAPYEKIHTARVSGDVVRLSFETAGLRPTRLALPADYANDKLKWLNQKNGSTYGSPVIAADYGLATMLVNSGTSAYLHKTYGTPLTLINPTITWDKVNKKITLTDIFLDNDLEETDPTVIYDDDETLWSAVGAGSAVAEETTIKTKGTSSVKITVLSGVANSGGLYTMAADADYSAKEFLCFYLYGANSGDAITVKILDNGAINGRSYAIVENFTGWKRFVVPILAMTAVGTGAVTAARKFYVLYDNPSANRTLYVDRTLVDVGQWVKVEAYVPNTLTGETSGWANWQLYTWNGSSYIQIEYISLDTVDGNHNGLPFYHSTDAYFLSGTTFTNVWGETGWQKRHGLAGYPFGYKSESKAPGDNSGSPGNITYSDYYGCLKRIGFAIKMPPGDGQDSSTYGISQCRLKLEVYYADSADPAGFYGQTSYEFEDSTNQYYGIDNLNSNWLALFDATNKRVYYFMTDKAPTGLKVCADENELIHWIEYTLPAGTRLYAGEIYREDIAVDSDGDGVPDVFEEVYDPALVLDLPMDEIVSGKVLDQTANHNDGTVYGATLVAGKAGNALSFDGTDDYVRVAHSASIMPTRISVTARIKLTNKNKYQSVIFKAYGVDYGGAYRLRIEDSNAVGFSIYTSTFKVTHDFTLTTDIWYYLAGVYDGANIIGYLNGVAGTPVAQTGDITSTTDPLWIGVRDRAGSKDLPFDGIIDEVRIYNRALSAAEILAIYDSGRKGHSNGVPALAMGVPTW